LKHLLLALCLLGTLSSFSQSRAILLDGSENGKPVLEVFQSLEEKYPVRFFYLPQWLEGLKFEQSYSGQTLDAALKDIFSGSDISFMVFYNYAYILSRDPARALEREKILNEARVEQKKILAYTFGNKANSSRNKKVKLSGTIKNVKTGEPMGGATIELSGIDPVLSRPDGSYAIEIPAGEYGVSYRYLNFDEKTVDLSIYESAVLNMDMEEVPRILEEVVVTDKQISNVEGRVGITALKMSEIKKMPAFLGEVDIIKQIQVLPGVTSVGEVSSGFNVRGGGADQNLIQYDGVPIFNNSHVFGFFSGVSSDAIKEATFLKGGIPAEYGGRISSILNIVSKEGSYEKWGAEGGIGLISSHLTVQGPVKKDVSSLMFSLRSSYSDWLLKAFTTRYQNIQNSSVSFYDASMKFTNKLGAKDKLSFSGYMSHDHFGLPNDTTFSWQNQAASLRLDHIFSETKSGSILMSFGHYGYEVTDEDPADAYKLRYDIAYPSLKADMGFEWGRHKTLVGLNSTYYMIHPGSIVANSAESSIVPITVQRANSLENAVFISDAFTVAEKLHIDLGFRLSMFSSLGPTTVRHYESGQPRALENIVDSTQFGSGKIVKNYYGPEPRLAFTFLLSPESSIKAGYNRMYQYIHLISNSVAINPIDIWQASNYYFKPQRGDQVSLGYFRNTGQGMYEFSLEGFYKKIQNILDFKDGADLVLNNALETAVLPAKGKSYGIEFSANKTRGRLAGSLNYTYSRSFRQVAPNVAGETINDGRQYRSNYDQPNILNLNWKYGLSRRFTFTGNFTYRTGRPVTVPVSYAIIDHTPIVNFSDRNQYRVPDYHRLDLALVMEGSHKRKKFWDGTWTLSFYNAYARKNVYTVFYGQTNYSMQKAYRMSIIGTVLPSLSYRFKI
jgi:hypothetical protein